ncbi:HD domain-containing protein, partial [bacterium]|nr:HD domain-containing protein [bacterium]
MELIAHTPPKTSPDREPHSYREHIEEALDYGKKIAAIMLDHCSADSEIKDSWIGAFIIAVLVHDLGKLDRENQKILTGQAKGRLPVDHIDAGVAVANGIGNELAAWLVRAHHSPGLPNKSTERKIWKRAKKRMNDAQWLRGKRHHRETDVEYIDEHVK